MVSLSTMATFDGMVLQRFLSISITTFHHVPQLQTKCLPMTSQRKSAWLASLGARAAKCSVFDAITG